ncbi:MAG: TonB-dependent receptor [Saprospiraceae bacterium]|nr:TonB-dependent receptor [Saprospiraceae bacterium]
MTLPSADSVTLTISYLGYETQKIKIALRKNTTQNINLSIKSLDLELVTVTPETSTPQMSTEILSLETLEKLPMLMGETDVLKMVQLLPGVQSGSEGSSGFHVRGGSPDQNLILLDGVPVYNASHLFGFFLFLMPMRLKK